MCKPDCTEWVVYKSNRLERASFSSSEHLGGLGHKRGPLWI